MGDTVEDTSNFLSCYHFIICGTDFSFTIVCNELLTFYLGPKYDEKNRWFCHHRAVNTVFQDGIPINSDDSKKHS